MNYSILSRGEHVDYGWDKPFPEAVELFKICRDEEGPIIVLKVIGDGRRADLLLGGIRSLKRKDRTKSTIRDAIYFQDIPERQARAILVAFAKNPERFSHVLDASISLDESKIGWVESDKEKIPQMINEINGEFGDNSEPWDAILQTAQPYGNRTTALTTAADVFTRYKLPQDLVGRTAIFGKYFRMEQRENEFLKNSFLIRCDTIRHDIFLAQKKTNNHRQSTHILQKSDMTKKVIFAIALIVIFSTACYYLNDSANKKKALEVEDIKQAPAAIPVTDGKHQPTDKKVTPGNAGNAVPAPSLDKLTPGDADKSKEPPEKEESKEP